MVVIVDSVFRHWENVSWRLGLMVESGGLETDVTTRARNSNDDKIRRLVFSKAEKFPHEVEKKFR